MKLNRIVFLVMLVVYVTIVLCGQGLAQFPRQINFQGVLEDAGGQPINTTTTVVFTIWDNDFAGINLWSETRLVTPVVDGKFDIILGEVMPIPDSAFTGTPAYLSMAVGGLEMTPRWQLVAVGYAFRVASVDGAAGGEISSKVSIGP
ncbi:MAG: hypothetical protein GY869_28855, partial [Planctomycetes bacterium]|nr:hypothetical protein [Planctomycetota bacterium]